MAASAKNLIYLFAYFLGAGLLLIVILNSNTLNIACKSAFKLNTEMDFYRLSLLCGYKNLPLTYKKLLLESSLIHMFVVSGAHIIFVEKLLNYCLLSKQPFLKFLLLLIFASACSMTPPVTRALFYFLITKINLKFHLYWPTTFKVIASLLLCLMYNLEWLSSYSLILSGLASLIVSTHKNSLLLLNTKIYFALMPFYLMWGLPHWMTLFTNALLLPIVSGALIPLALLSLVSPLQTPIELLIKSFFKGLSWITLLKLGTPPLTLSLSPEWLWTYLILLLFLIDWRQRSRKKIK